MGENVAYLPHIEVNSQEIQVSNAPENVELYFCLMREVA